MHGQDIAKHMCSTEGRGGLRLFIHVGLDMGCPMYINLPAVDILMAFKF